LYSFLYSLRVIGYRLLLCAAARSPGRDRRERHGVRLSGPLYDDVDGGADVQAELKLGEVVRDPHRFAVDLDDDVARLYACTPRGTARVDRLHEQTR